MEPFSKKLIEEKFEIKREYGDPPILAKRKNSTGPKSRDEIRKIVVSYYKNLHKKKLAPITIVDSDNDDDDDEIKIEDEPRDTPPANEIPETGNRISAVEVTEENEKEATSMHSREPSSYDVIVRVITTNTAILFTLIRESLKKKSKTLYRHRACFPGKKIQGATLHEFVYVSVLWIFFRKARSVTIPKMAYIFVQRDILTLILAYAI